MSDLNHLLNFRSAYVPPPAPSSSPRSSSAKQGKQQQLSKAASAAEKQHRHAVGPLHHYLSSPELHSLHLHPTSPATLTPTWASVLYLHLFSFPSDPPICPLCLSPPLAPQSTFCKHVFCAVCSSQYKHHKLTAYNEPQPCPCPCCADPDAFTQPLKPVSFTTVDQPVNTASFELVATVRPRITPPSSNSLPPYVALLRTNLAAIETFQAELSVTPDPAQALLAATIHADLTGAIQSYEELLHELPAAAAVPVAATVPAKAAVDAPATSSATPFYQISTALPIFLHGFSHTQLLHAGRLPAAIAGKIIESQTVVLRPENRGSYAFIGEEVVPNYSRITLMQINVSGERIAHD